MKDLNSKITVSPGGVVYTDVLGPDLQRWGPSAKPGVYGVKISQEKTMSQRNYFHGPICDWMSTKYVDVFGDTPGADEIAEDMKDRYLPKIEVSWEAKGKKIQKLRRKSFEKCSKAEISQFVEAVIGFCIEWIEEPPPEAEKWRGMRK